MHWSQLLLTLLFILAAGLILCRAPARHMITILASLLALVVLWLVPPVHNILFHLPAYTSEEESRYLCLWTGFTWMLVIVYVTITRWVVRPDLEILPARYQWMVIGGFCIAAVIGLLKCFPRTSPGVQHISRWLPVPLDLILLLAATLLAPSLFAPRAKTGGVRRFFQRALPWAGVVTLLITLGFFLVVGALQTALLSTIAVALGLWILLRRQGQTSQFRDALLRFALMWAALFFAVGELIWVLPTVFPNAVSHEAYTVWAVYHSVFTVLAVARLVDQACASPRLSGFPVRRVAVVVLVILALLFLRPVTVGRRTAPSDPSQISQRWFEAVNARLDAIEDNGGGPAVVIAASGGGSRAAMFTSLVYEALRSYDEAVHDPIARDVLASLRDRILLISSVSGGSLATAYFVERAYSNEEAIYELDHWVHSVPSEVEHWLTEYSGVKRSVPSWMNKSLFVDDMARSFMAPLLRGVFLPGRERGESVTNYWKKEFRWSERVTNETGFVARKSGLKDGRQNEDLSPAPVVLFNTTNIEAGQRLIVGFPKLPVGLTQGTRARSLSGLDAGYTVTLSEAVRISANFPWGFCAPKLEVENKQGPVSITDGGVVDNTGLDSVLSLVHGLKLRAETPPKEGEDEDVTVLRDLSAKLLDRLRNIGILLLVIDSGARPDEQTALGQAFPELFEPLRGLSNASNATGATRTEPAVVLLQHYLSCGDDDQTSGGVDSFSVICHNANSPRVMTAWSLGHRDKGQLIANFLEAFETMAKPEEVELLAQRLELFETRRKTKTKENRSAIDEFRFTARRHEDSLRRLRAHEWANRRGPIQRLQSIERKWKSQVDELSKKLPTR